MIKTKVYDVIADSLCVEKDKLTDETEFETDLGVDSLDTIELVMILEDKFNITIPDDDEKKLKTVGQLVEYIEKRNKK